MGKYELQHCSFRPQRDLGLRFSRTRTLMRIGLPSKPKVSRSRRSKIVRFHPKSSLEIVIPGGARLHGPTIVGMFVGLAGTILLVAPEAIREGFGRDQLVQRHRTVYRLQESVAH